MSREITTIECPLRLMGFIRMGTVNCYLIKTEAGFILIDTVVPGKQDYLDNRIENAGCHPGDLKLIVLTHGDLDHIGNGAYLQRKYGTKIGIHPIECPAIETGDASLSRKHQPLLPRLVFGLVLNLIIMLSRFGRLETFSADLCFNEGDDLSAWGLDAKILHLPGHSRGSIGVLTADGDLFCGDLLWNSSKPEAHSILDSHADFERSVEKLNHQKIWEVFPGHGKPFRWEQFAQAKH